MGIKTSYCSVSTEYYTELEAFANSRNLIYISISVPGDENRQQHITLDKKTAIRLAKDLRREISFLED